MISKETQAHIDYIIDRLFTLQMEYTNNGRYTVDENGERHYEFTMEVGNTYTIDDVEGFAAGMAEALKSNGYSAVAFSYRPKDGEEAFAFHGDNADDVRAFKTRNSRLFVKCALYTRNGVSIVKDAADQLLTETAAFASLPFDLPGEKDGDARQTGETPLKKLVLANRSYRGYDETYRFTEAALKAYVDFARFTPSSINKQPLKYYLAWEKETVDLIQSLTKWARALPEMTLPHPGMCPTGFIIICQDTDISPNLQRFQKDVGIVAQTILLAATEQGNGGCMIGNFKPESVSAALHFSENIVPQLIVALGRPKETIVLTEVGADGSTDYYRDGDDVHYVPKRALEDIIIS